MLNPWAGGGRGADHLTEARVRYNSGQLEDAVASFARALTMDPSNGAAALELTEAEAMLERRRTLDTRELVCAQVCSAPAASPCVQRCKSCESKATRRSQSGPRPHALLLVAANTRTTTVQR